MNEVFADGEALANTCEILDKVETYSIDHAPIMPFFPIPEEFGTRRHRRNFTEQQLFDEFTRDENGNVIMSQEEGEKKSRSWVVMTRYTVSSSKATIWQNWLMTVRRNVMETLFRMMWQNV